ncbi:hypothetical protein FRB99_005152 [Tulasnella sp. 403]|nr:hypothetical protein FRB99_005152 [Tulasnella sp. 403]
MSGRRLYLGRLPADTRPEDVTKHFDGYGKIVECRVMTGFGFVEFENPKDADDVVHNFNGKSFLGQSSIIVEFAKDTRRGGGDPYYSRAPPRGPPRRPAGFRVNVSGISRDTSWQTLPDGSLWPPPSPLLALPLEFRLPTGWPVFALDSEPQDLKDFGREAGSVTFADVDRNDAGHGVLEYASWDDADHAVRTLDGKDLRGVAVRLALDEARDRRSPPRRDRSRSPYRRRDDRERRRSRSPPRRHEERRDEFYRRDERRDDRRDDRDRERKYDREVERGDGGWANGDRR